MDTSILDSWAHYKKYEVYLPRGNMGINFQKSVWIDRIFDNTHRRKLTKVKESVSYVVERDDNPTVEGTAFCASTMNNLEDRIANITPLILRISLKFILFRCLNPL